MRRRLCQRLGLGFRVRSGWFSGVRVQGFGLRVRVADQGFPKSFSLFVVQEGHVGVI